MKSTSVNDLLSIIEQERIFLSYQDFSGTPTLHGMYWMNPDGVAFIILDESIRNNPVMHRAVLAEELGHHFAKVHTNFLTSDETSILRDEVAALRWAVKLLSSTTTQQSQSRRRGGFNVTAG